MVFSTNFARIVTILAVTMLALTTLTAETPISRSPAIPPITIVTALTPASWPLYIAKEAGYYQRYGLEVNLEFGIHPAGIAMVLSEQAKMTNYTLEQAMQAVIRDSSLAIIGSFSKKSLFALMAREEISSVSALKGKRIGVSQIGDGPYTYTVKILAKFGLTVRDVQWVPVGTNARAAALIAGRVDATPLNAPTYFSLEDSGYRALANIADFDDIYTVSVHLFKKKVIAETPDLPEKLLQAHAEAVKRFYQDKAFAVKSFLTYDRQNARDVERVYDQYTRGKIFERIPYVPAAAVKYIIESQADPRIALEMKAFDFRTAIDNSPVDHLASRIFFENAFGPAIRVELDSKKQLAFR
jgi:ABC-type nitrate/sulfonate/bicarbonate transport system substrate-binding protein